MYSDYSLILYWCIYMYIYVSTDESCSLLQVLMVELGSLHGTSIRTLLFHPRRKNVHITLNIIGYKCWAIVGIPCYFLPVVRIEPATPDDFTFFFLALFSSHACCHCCCCCCSSSFLSSAFSLFFLFFLFSLPFFVFIISFFSNIILSLGHHSFCTFLSLLLLLMLLFLSLMLLLLLLLLLLMLLLVWELIFIYLLRTFPPSSGSFLCCFFFHYVSAKFPLAFFRWFYRDLG